MVKSKKDIQFNESDLTKIIDALAELSQRVKYKQSLNQLLSRWRSFCVEVQRGYSATIYDYENELSVRDILEAILSSLSEDGRQKICDRIANDDDIFMLATKASIVPEHKNTSSMAWWHQRIPIKLTEDLRQEFSDAGYRIV